MSSRRIWISLLSLVVVAGFWWGWRNFSGRPTLVQAREILRAAEGNLGYGVALEAELKKIGLISPEEFAQLYGGKVKYGNGLSWDPMTAHFWDRFNLDPNQPGLKVRLQGGEERQAREWAKQQGHPLPEDKPVLVPAAGGYDFRMNGDELAKFKQHGFMVSERMGAPSCTEMFYRIYKRDLPVFVSADAVLHAWHRTYDAILVEIETGMLIPALDDILSSMTAKVPEAHARYANELFGPSIADADYFLAVARSLLAGTPTPSLLGQDERVRATLQACADLKMQKFVLFGRERDVDFSQFKPRGHYEKSEELRRYFKAMMWCGRTDLRVAGNPSESAPREMASAVVLYDLLQKSGKFERWQQFDRVLRTMIGNPDSMTFAQLGAVLAAGGIRSPADVKDDAALSALQARVEAGNFGAQEIQGDVFVVPFGSPKLILPRSFTFLGQRFAVDSWVTAKTVFDDVRWHDDEAVMRRIPSCLDVAFAAFANDHTVPALVERMNHPAGRRFRDGPDYPYQHNLAAARAVIDAKPAAMWRENLYTGWLGSLRELSKPTTDAKYPEALRTQAWALKTLNTQLASWSQLRHDTILYVKQSYSIVPGCYYPAGFVEPVPHFWSHLHQMAERAATLIEATPYGSAADLQKKHALFLKNFARTMSALQEIAEKELAQMELTKEETKFLEDVIEVTHVRVGSGGERRYAGWYPGLFYEKSDCLKWDALVADIHTNPEAVLVGDPGCVVHQGVGSVDLLLIAIDNGKDRMIYAGPVLSHYEFEMPHATRKTDSEWKADLRAGRTPPRPEWTRGYLVPGENKDVKHYSD